LPHPPDSGRIGRRRYGIAIAIGIIEPQDCRVVGSRQAWPRRPAAYSKSARLPWFSRPCRWWTSCRGPALTDEWAQTNPSTDAGRSTLDSGAAGSIHPGRNRKSGIDLRARNFGGWPDRPLWATIQPNALGMRRQASIKAAVLPAGRRLRGLRKTLGELLAGHHHTPNHGAPRPRQHRPRQKQLASARKSKLTAANMKRIRGGKVSR
jgi:hypothetical protein